MLSPRDDQLALVVGRVALVVASAVTVSLPLGYFALAYTSSASILKAKAEIKAASISQLIGTNPALWIYQAHRLEELLSRNPLLLENEAAYARDVKDSVVAQAGEPPAFPVMRRSDPLHDSGRVVGRIEMARSYRDVIVGTAIATALGLLLGAAVFFTLRILPLRALRRVTDALFAEKERAEVTLHSIGDAVITTDAGELV